MVTFSEINTWKNEPMTILKNLDALPEEFLRKVFPLYPKYLEGKPTILLPLIKSGIESAIIIESTKYRDYTYNKIDYNDIWNQIAMIYEYHKDYEKAKRVFEIMFEVGASDSATLNNYSAVLLNELINKRMIVKEDEAQFYSAKEKMYKAFIFDTKGKPKEILHAANAPAYRNIIIIRNIESELYYNEDEIFTSFILGWISVEMNLNRIWCRFLNDQSNDNNLKEKFLKYNLDQIIDHIYLVNIIDKKLRDEINKYRSIRNNLIHGTIFDVTKGDAMNIIQLSRKLYPITAD